MRQQQVNTSKKYDSKYITRYSPQKFVDHEKELSPWSNIDQYRRHFRPSQYYQTITKQQKLYNNSHQNNLVSLPVNLTHHPFASRVTKDFANLVKLQKKGAFMHCQQRKSEQYPLKRNLVMVSLEQNPQDSIDKSNQTTVHYLNKSRHRESRIQKEQPMHVKIFKKLKQKNKVKKQTIQHQMQISLPYEGQKNKSQNTENIHVYQVMPKRSLRLTNYRQKMLNSSFQNTKNEYFPRIVKQKNIDRSQKLSLEAICLFCKGEIIKKSISLQQKQTKGNKNESILSLQQFSSSN